MLFFNIENRFLLYGIMLLYNIIVRFYISFVYDFSYKIFK